VIKSAGVWAILRRLFLGFFLIAVASAILLFSDLPSQKATKASVPKLALLQMVSTPTIEEAFDGLMEGLGENGYRENKNYTLRRFVAENDIATANAIARQMTSGDYEIALTFTTPCMQAVANANRRGKTIHVFSVVTDPFAAGIGLDRKKLSNHPAHLVGLATPQPAAETFRMMKKMFPELTSVGTLYNPAEVNSQVTVGKARVAAKELGIQLLEATVEQTSGVLEAATSLANRGVEVLWIGGDSTVYAGFEALVQASKKAHIPVTTCSPGNTKRGSLFDLGANYFEIGKHAGEIAASILNGRSPASIPIQEFVPPKMTINLKALNGLKDNWSFPPEILRQANEVIQ